jgi:8-oxo-dGTP pyrophosphatase MutT (NUDIX family)
MKKPSILIQSRWLKVILEDLQLPDGTVIKDFYTAERPAYSGVVPVLSSREILLVKQYRHGPRKNILNIPQGVTQKNESHLATARRELIEEPGYGSSQIKYLGTFDNAPSFLRLQCRLFLSLNVKRYTNQFRDQREPVSVVKLSLTQALQKIARGDIRDMATVIGILRANELLKK